MAAVAVESVVVAIPVEAVAVFVVESVEVVVTVLSVVAAAPVWFLSVFRLSLSFVHLAYSEKLVKSWAPEFHSVALGLY